MAVEVTGTLARDMAHPDLPGEATTGEMLRSFWPFTVGRRRRLAVAFLLSLAQFGIAAALPLLTGSLLSSALRSTTAAEAVTEYSQGWLARAGGTARLVGDLAPGSSDPAAIADAIRATEALQSVAAARAVVDDLFPGGLVYDTTGTIGRDLHRQIGESDDAWVVTALAAVDDGRLGRSELDELAASDDVADQRAFDFLVGVLALDDSAGAQRRDRQIHLLVDDIVRFAGAISALAVVRLAAARLSLRALLGSGRSLQDAVFVRLHESMLLESGAIPRPSMVSRCSGYVDHVVRSLRGLLTSGIPAVMNLVLSVALLVWIDPWIGLIMLVTVTAFEVVRRAVTPSWSRSVRELIDRNTAVGEVVDEAVTGERATRLQRAERLERRRFGDAADRVRSTLTRLGRYAADFDVGAVVVGQFGVVVITALVGIGRRDLSVGQATAAVLYAQAVAAAVAAIPPTVIELQEAAPYMRRLRRVLLSPPRWIPPASPLAPPAVVDTIVADGLETIDLDGRDVLKGLTFAAHRGSITVVVGASADEGDHIVRSMGGLERPARGAVLVEGVDVAQLAPGDAARVVHVMPRFVTLFAAGLDDNVTLGEPARCSVAESVERAGLSDFVAGLTARANSASSSDRRGMSAEALARLGVARAVSSMAGVIVVEDPSQTLDHEAARRWWQLLRVALADRIVVVVTDQVDLMDERDVVTVVRHGVVVESGSRQALLESGRWFPSIWERWSSSARDALDLSSLSMLARLDRDALEDVADRMVTERYESDEPIYMTGDPADRVFVVLDGRVEVFDSGRRVASVGPGGSFGEFAGADALRTTTARARGAVVVRSLHRLAMSSGLLGVLDRSPTEQRVYALLTRRGELRLEDLEAALPGVDVTAVVASLTAAGLVVAGSGDGAYRPAPFARRPRPGTGRLLS